jgi:DNA replication protein DnaC
MSELQHQRIEELCQELRLAALPGLYGPIAQAAAKKKDVSYADFLEEALRAERESRRARSREMLTRTAGFPAIKTLEAYDFGFATGAPRAQLLELASLSFVERAENVVLLGPSGTGKTHLAIALAIKACQHGHRVAFATAQRWVTRLETAQDRNTLDDELRRLERYGLLVVDEVGYLPLERQAANLLFALVSRRYERGSIIITSNRGFEAWGEILGDAMVAAALIDRLIHHAHIVTLKGKSYRLRERGTGTAPAIHAPPLRGSA